MHRALWWVPGGGIRLLTVRLLQAGRKVAKLEGEAHARKAAQQDAQRGLSFFFFRITLEPRVE